MKKEKNELQQEAVVAHVIPSRIPLLNEGITKGDYKALRLTSDTQLYQAYELRHQIIVHEWKWLKENGSNKEYDLYDFCSDHFAVYHESKMVAYARMIKAHGLSQMMLQRDFFVLVKDKSEELEKEIEQRWGECVEVSRLIIHPEYRVHAQNVLYLLYTIMVRWADTRNMHYWYFVVDRKFFESLKRQNFIVHEFANGSVVPGGDVCVAGWLDLKASYKNLKDKVPDIHREIFGNIEL